MPGRDRMTDATRRALRDDRSRFPRSGHGDQRLTGVATVSPTPTFRLLPGEEVFTIGSCFARNVEEHLNALGFRIPTLEFSVPAGEFGGARRNGILNKYSPPSILAELADAFEEEVDDDRALVPTADGRVIDVRLAADIAVDVDRARDRRREVRTLFRRAFRSDVVVITLGQTETWWDCTGEQYCNIFPPASIHRIHPGRFEFEQLSFERCRADLVRSIEILRHAGGASRILVSVSPVPLGRTFTGEDAVSAYIRSKSVLRAVADEIAHETPGVDYLPTYESVLLTERARAFDDSLHVRDEVVAEVVRRSVDAYLRAVDRPDGPDGPANGAPADTSTQEEPRDRAIVDRILRR